MKIPELQDGLRDANLDACILMDTDPNVFYFAGVELERCTLVIPSKGEPAILAVMLEEERIKADGRIGRVLSFSTAVERDKVLRGLLKDFRRIAVNRECLSLRNSDYLKSVAPIHELVDCSGNLSMLRQVKTSGEIELIREACRRTDVILGKTISQFDFRTELEVKNHLHEQVIRLGDKLSFDTIVASGKNASMPHYSGSGKLQNGFCVIDFGIRHKGYCSDMTRTVYVGKPGRKDREMYELVRAAQQKGIGAAKDSAVAADVDAAARKALGRHSSSFIHGLGHHIGIEVHDAGFRIAPGSKGVLKSGMTITIEPGIYFPGKSGIRIEDDLLVRKGRSELLTNCMKEFTVVG